MPFGRPGAGKPDLLSIEGDGPRIRPPYAHDGLDDLRLAGTDRSGKRQDLSRPYRKGHVFDQSAHAEMLYLQHRLLAFQRGVHRPMLPASLYHAHHFIDEFFLCDFSQRPGAGVDAVPQYRDMVTNFEQLLQPMGYVDDRDLPLRLAPPDGVEKRIGLGGAQAAGRLIQNQYLGVAVQGTDDTDDLLFGHGQLGNLG